MLKPTEELNEYISLVTLDFMEKTYNDKSMISIERERQIDTRIGIIALLKLYKRLPLSDIEKELIAKYPIRDDHRLELEGRIAYMALNIGEEAWNKVNKIRIETETYERQYNISTLKMFDANGNETNELKDMRKMITVRPSDPYYVYLEYLDEYIEDLRHAWGYRHKISLITTKREEVEPMIDFDSECFIEFIPKTSKIMPLIRKITKK